jgi:hypothetical protein
LAGPRVALDPSGGGLPDPGQDLGRDDGQFGAAPRATSDGRIRARRRQFLHDLTCGALTLEPRQPDGDRLVDAETEVGIGVGLGIMAQGGQGPVRVSEGELDGMEGGRRVAPSSRRRSKADLEPCGLIGDCPRLDQPSEVPE